MLTQPPTKPFEELGVFDVFSGRGYIPENVPAFRKMADKQVCAAGGDAVIVLANGHGQYMKATVIRWQMAAPAVAPAPAPTTP